MALYDLKKRPALTSKEDEGEVYYPKLISSGKITTEQLLRELSEYSTFNTGEAEGILCDLLHLVSKHVSEGYRVELGDFGVFSAKLNQLPSQILIIHEKHTFISTGCNSVHRKSLRTEQ